MLDEGRSPGHGTRALPLLLAVLTFASAGTDAATLAVTPDAAPPATTVTASGEGYGPGERVLVRFDRTLVATPRATGAGTFTAELTIPPQARPGRHVVVALGRTTQEVAHAPLAVRTDWPNFRFDAAHTGTNPYENVLTPTNVPALRLAWQQQLAEPVDYSSPTIVAGVAYIGTRDGGLWAVDANGCGGAFCTEPLWIGRGGIQVIDSPLWHDGVVYVGAQESQTSNDGRLLAFAADGCGAPVCVPLWKGDAGPQSILQSSPAAFEDTILVGSFDGRLYAFAAGGCGEPLCAPLWTAATGGHIESSPTIIDGVAYVGSNDRGLYAFDARGCGAPTCSPLWRGAAGGPIFESSPAVANGIVYVGTDHALVAFDAAGCGAPTCQPLWQGRRGQDFVSGSPAVANGFVYIGLENGLGVFDANGCGAPTCAPVWTGFGPGTQAVVASSPAVANGVVYVGRNTAEVFAFDANGCGAFQCNPIWTGRTDSQIVTSSPAVVDGRLYIGSADSLAPLSISGRLYVFDLPGAP